MQYQEAVAEVRRLDQVIQGHEEAAERSRQEAENARWRQAELVWQQVKPRGAATMEQVGADCNRSSTAISTWVRVYERYGRMEAGFRPTYSIAYQAVDKGLDPENVYAERNQMEARRTVRNMSTADRAAVAREVLADPDARRQVMSDQETRRQLWLTSDQALADQYITLSAPSSEEITQRRESSQRETDLLDLRDNLNRAAGLLRIALRQALETTLTGQERDFIRASAEEAVEQAGNWQAYLGGQNLDAFLAELTEGES
jgi:hypothetical protein